MALERLQVNVEGDLLRQVDAYADSLHITRTAAVSVLLSRALQADKLAADLSEGLLSAKNKESVQSTLPCSLFSIFLHYYLSASYERQSLK